MPYNDLKRTKLRKNISAHACGLYNKSETNFLNFLQTVCHKNISILMFYTTLVNFSIGKSEFWTFCRLAKTLVRVSTFIFCLFYIFFSRCGPKMRSIQSFIFLLRNRFWCNMVEVFFLELKVEGWKIVKRQPE